MIEQARSSKHTKLILHASARCVQSTVRITWSPNGVQVLSAILSTSVQHLDQSRVLFRPERNFRCDRSELQLFCCPIFEKTLPKSYEKITTPNHSSSRRPEGIDPRSLSSDLWDSVIMGSRIREDKSGACDNIARTMDSRRRVFKARCEPRKVVSAI